MSEQKKKRGAPKGHPAYNTKGEGGAPKKWTEETINKEADALLEWLQKPSSVWFEKFAFERGYAIQRLSEWAKINKRFLEAYTRAKDWQLIKLLEGGLFKKFEPKITKLLLSHCYKMNEQSNVHQTGDPVIQVVHFGGDPKPWKSEEEKDER